MGGFQRKQWLWAKVVLGGVVRMWVYLISLDLNFLICKMGSMESTQDRMR